MALTEFEIDGKEYRLTKLSAMQQLHVSRRVSPLIPALIPVFMQIAKEKGSSDNFEVIGALLQPFADGLAGMKDEDAEYVFSTCLGALKRKSGENWTPVWNVSGKVVMFEDLNDLSQMIRLVIRVISDALGPFIRGFLTNQMTETQAA